MRFLIALVLSAFFLCGTAQAENYIADEAKDLCGEWKTNPSGMAFADDGKKLYVTDALANRVMVISPRTQHIENIIKTKMPTLAITPATNGQKAYVLSGNADENMILVLDAATDKPIETIAIGAGYPQGLALNEDGSELYIPWTKPEKISIVKLADRQSSYAEISAQTLGPIRVTKSRLYALSSGYLNVIGLESGKEVAHVPIDHSAYFLALNPEGSTLAVIHQDIFKKGEGQVMFLGTKDNAEIANVTIRGEPASAVFAPDGKTLYVADQQPMKAGMPDKLQPDNITVVDASTYKIAATIPMKGGIGAAVVSADNKRAYFITAIRIPDKKRFLIEMVVSVVDTKVGKVIGDIPIPVPEAPAEKCGDTH